MRVAWVHVMNFDLPIAGPTDELCQFKTRSLQGRKSREEFFFFRQKQVFLSFFTSEKAPLAVDLFVTEARQVGVERAGL